MNFRLFGIVVLLTFTGHVNSQGLICTPHPTHPDIVEYLIDAESRLGEINTILVHHDINRKVPVVTNTLLNYLNNEHNVSRVDNFRRYPCTEEGQTGCSQTFKMTPEQQQISNGRSSFDRGHLVPSHPFTFSRDANNGTFYCVNIAPQDPYTNQAPWNRMEQVVLSYFQQRAGYVLTGTCDQNNVYSPTLDGYHVPDCYWKLICYRDNAGTTQVVGFIGNNTIVPQGDSQQQTVRTADTLTPRSQQDVINRLNINHLSVLMESYDDGQDVLLRNRNENRVPTAEQCKAVRNLPAAVKEEWSNLMKNAVIEEPMLTDDEQLDMELLERLWGH